MAVSLLPEEAAVAKVLSTCSLAPREFFSKDSLPVPWTPTEARGVGREGVCVRLLELSQCPGVR